MPVPRLRKIMIDVTSAGEVGSLTAGWVDPDIGHSSSRAHTIHRYVSRAAGLGPKEALQRRGLIFIILLEPQAEKRHRNATFVSLKSSVLAFVRPQTDWQTDCTPLQFCGPSISTDLFSCTFSLQNSSRQGDEGPGPGLGYGSHIERSVVSSRLTYFPPVS